MLNVFYLSLSQLRIELHRPRQVVMRPRVVLRAIKFREEKVLSFSPPPQEADRLRQSLGLHEERPVWVLFTSSEDELVGSDAFKRAFATQLEWIQHLIAYIEKYPEIDLVIRVHPNTGGKKTIARNETQLEEFRRLAQRLPANVRMVMPDDVISTYSLMDIATLGLVYMSTTGLEMACKGKKVIAITGSFADKSFTLTPHSFEEFESLLDSARTFPLAYTSEETQRLAYRYSYMLFYRWNIPFPLVEMVDTYTPRLRYQSKEELAPGKEPNLDRVCRIILEGEPIVLPPTEEDLRDRSEEQEKAWFGERGEERGERGEGGGEETMPSQHSSPPVLQHSAESVSSSPSSPLSPLPSPLSSVAWSAPFLEQGDDADDARSLTLGLESLGLPVKIEPVKLTGQRAELDEPQLQKLEQMHDAPLSERFVHVIHLTPAFYERAPGAITNIGRANFGTDRLPIEWVPHCNEMDEIWVPSDFNIDSFAFSGVDRKRLHKIPLCFDAQKFGEHVPLNRMSKEFSFWFLAVIDWHYASGWDALLRACMEEFSADDDLSLMLQLMLPAGVTPQDAAEEIRSFLKDDLKVSSPHANLEISIDPLRPGLYRAADAFILPSRGESLGLHCLEAMASGLPIIATGWGGHTEFMTTENSWPIDYQMTDVPDEVVAEIPFLAGSRWAEPDTRHLRSLMRHAFENREETTKKGKAAAAHAAENFSREKVAQLVKTRLTRMSLPHSPPPRILVGTGPFGSFRENLKDVARTYDVLSVGEEEGDIRWACEKDTFQDILERLPDGWQPDLVLWLCHYHPIPQGIEHSPFPTVAAVGDWNLLFTSFKDDLKRFDRIVTDKAGVEMLRHAGFENVDYWPMFSYDVFQHRRIENTKRIYDVVMIGNFNHDVQHERSYWLHRLAKLKNRFDIHLLCGIYGEDYTRLLNQAKIVFNRSIRGEMNMRAYEATACGSLLFFEEENLEIRDFFQDRVECVLYNEDNLEELLEYYLTHDEERERIAEAGYQRVQQETQRHHFEQLVALMQERNVVPANHQSTINHPRPFLDLPEPQRLFRQARQAFEKQKPNGESLQAAEKLLIQVLDHDPAHTETYNALGVLNGYYSQLVQDENAKNELFSKAEQSFANGLKHGPNDALLLYNLGILHVMSGQTDPAEAALNLAIQSIEQNQPLQCRELILPRTFNAFFVEWERIAAELIHDPAAADNARRQLLLRQCCDWLGDIATFKELTSAAVELYQRAIDARPDLAGRPRHKLAGLLHQLGQTEEAIEQCRLAYTEEPFNTQLWKDLVAILRESGRNEEAESFRRELLTIVEACPAYKESQAWLEESVQHSERAGPYRGECAAVSVTPPAPEKSWLENAVIGVSSIAPGMIEVNGVSGWIALNDIRFLNMKSRELPLGGVIVEIGSFMGLSSIVMGHSLFEQNNIDARIYCIDAWEGSEEHQEMDVIKSRELYDVFLENINGADIGYFIYPIRKWSTEAFEDFEDLSIDLLFVDGDHSFEGCYADLKNFFPKMKHGGIIIGHDYMEEWGVPDAVKKFCKEHRLEHRVIPTTHGMYEIQLPPENDETPKASS